MNTPTVSRCARKLRGGGRLLALLSLGLASGPAAAGDFIALSPNYAYGVDRWRPAGGGALNIHFVVRHQVTMALDQLMQVAPGGETIAGCDPSKRLVLFASSGSELWHRDDQIPAFRFSPTGAELALASDKGIEILTLAGLKVRDLATLPSVEWLRWADGGLLARARSNVYLIDAAGARRLLTALPRGAIVAASHRRLVYFAYAALVDVDLATEKALSLTKLTEHARVIDAQLSPDGTRILFATAKRVYLIEGQTPPTKLADVDRLQSLHFSPDGSSFLWASWSGGALVANGKTMPLPTGAFDARFRQDGGAEIVVTSQRPGGVALWNPVTGGQTPLGGLRPIAADYAGGFSVTLYVERSLLDKRQEVPGRDLGAEGAVVF